MTVDRRIVDPEWLGTYLRGGNAVISVRSTRTNRHFTFRITRSIHRAEYYYVTRRAEDLDWPYIGMIDESKPVKEFRATDATKKKERERLSFQVFKWFYELFAETGQIHPQLEIFYDGRCASCSNWLTTPESLERGFGPTCWKRHKLLWEKAAG